MCKAIQKFARNFTEFSSGEAAKSSALIYKSKVGFLREESVMGQTLQDRHSTKLATIEAEALSLVQQGLVGRHQPIYTLCRYIPTREWVEVELELGRVIS